MWENNWKSLLNEIVNTGFQVDRSKKKSFKEMLSYKFTLENPRDRLISEKTRAVNIFQCVGQFLWITQGNFNLEAIRYYQPIAGKFSSDGIRVIGAYGPRLFGVQHLNQMKHITKILDEDTTRRRAVASIYLPQFDQHEIKNEEVPCTLNLQYLVRDGKLNAITFMRSQDVFKVLPYDVFVFTMLQEYLTAVLQAAHDIELGTYHHFSGSFHVYTDDMEDVHKVLSSTSNTNHVMEKMPSMDIDLRLKELNKFESIVRNMVSSHSERKVKLDFDFIFSMLNDYFKDNYWRQLALVLTCYGAIKMEDSSAIEKSLKMLDPIYQYFANLHIEKMKSFSQKTT